MTMDGVTSSKTSDRTILFVLLGIIVVLLSAPSFLFIWTGRSSGHPWRIGSLTWLFGYNSEGSFGFFYRPEGGFGYFYSVNALGLYTLRYMTLFMVYRLLQGQSSLRLTLVGALLGEIQFTLMANMSLILMILTGFTGTSGGAVYLPIPFLFIAILMVARLIPAPEPEKMWIEDEKSKAWWDTPDV
ncbi:MAG: hypothetical protein ACW99U_15180 [Candidatus Thorarchaeota archaeon]|jgi:hypothetical protein